MASTTFLIGIQRYRESQGGVSTMVPWLATQFLGGLSYIPLYKSHISANDCQYTSRLSRAWCRWSISWCVSARTWKQWIPLASSTSSSEGSAILFSPGLGSSFEVAPNKVVYRSFGSRLHVCRNEQWWAHGNTDQNSWFTESLCVRNNTKRGVELASILLYVESLLIVLSLYWIFPSQTQVLSLSHWTAILVVNSADMDRWKWSCACDIA